jgi:hypothetical protein
MHSHSGKMMKWLILAALLVVSPAIAADAPVRQIAGDWTILPGETDTLHGIWMVSGSTGKIYRCQQYAGQAACVEAAMFTAEQWAQKTHQQQH